VKIAFSIISKKNMKYEIQYRLLNEEEKKIFYKDFITFLSVQGIDGKLWKETKEKEPKKALLLFAQFSDLVIHRSLENVIFLMKVRANETEIIFADEEWIHILSVPENTKDIDHLKLLVDNNPLVQKTKVVYPSMGREKWIFMLVEQQGYTPKKEDFRNLFDTK
jgi:hypothetical protein